MRKWAILGCILSVFVIAAYALLLSINTDQFKALITERIKNKTGQALTIQGSLQWRFSYGLYLHAGKTLLTSPAGYQDPYILQAKDISLNIGLFPLLSKQLVINDLQLGGVTAVLEIAANGTSNWDALARDDISTDSEQKHPNIQEQTLPALSSTTQVSPHVASEWDIILRKITVNESRLIWRKAADSVVFNQLNIALGHAVDGIFPLQLSSSIILPHDTLVINYQGQLSLNENLNNISLKKNNLEITLRNNISTTMAENKIISTFSAELNRKEGKVTLNNIHIDSPIAKITGEIVAKTKPVPGFVDINISSPYLDLDALLPLWKDVMERVTSPKISHYQNISLQNENKKNSVFADTDHMAIDSQSDSSSKKSSLYHTGGFVTLRVNKIQWRKQHFDALFFDATLQQGIVSIDRFSMNGLGGVLKATGTINLLNEPKTFEISPVLTQVELSSLLNWVQAGVSANGVLNMTGKWLFSGWPSIDSSHGFMTLLLHNVEFKGVNLPYLISSSIARAKGKNVDSESVIYQTYLDKMAVDVNFNQGKLKIARMNASASKFALNATGNVNLLTNQCDLALNNRIQLPNNDTLFVNVPLYVYGSLKNLNYRIDMVEILKQQLQESKQKLRNKLKNQDAL
ncbi:MAG: AsmA family protein [Plesiomonas sp.]|uniref:AsmA family protein n=1 Tax=Plesiomonas sp. TaxID=2486279 RepID=UPI003F387AD7